MTGILATICGGGTWHAGTVRALMALGVRSFRITPAFRSEDENLALIVLLRSVAAEVGTEPDIYYDVSRGCKVRTTNDRSLVFRRGQVIAIGDQHDADIRSERTLPPGIAAGTPVFLGDSELVLRVVKPVGSGYRCTVVDGGTLRSRKGITVSGVRLGDGAVNPSNEPDLRFAVRHGLSHVILSFVEDATDVARCRAVVGDRIRVVAKIETTSAMRNLDEIMSTVDIAMVARGDLALQCGYENLALLQWEIARAARFHGRPFIVATQVFESVLTRLIPTRSDIMDLSSAVASGAHAVMFGPETCTNPDAVRAVSTAKRIIDAVAAGHRPPPGDRPDAAPPAPRTAPSVG